MAVSQASAIVIIAKMMAGSQALLVEFLAMRRRRLLLGMAAILLTVGGLALVHWLTAPTPGVTWENFRHLRIGMSVKDLEALLGEPYETAEQPDGVIQRVWRGEEVEITLWFGTEEDDVFRGRLASGAASFPRQPNSYVENMCPDESVLDRIRRWLHL